MAAADPGGGGGFIPPPPPSGGVPQSGAAINGGAAGSWFPQIYSWLNAPVVNTPDYASLINQQVAPYQTLYDQQMQQLQSSIDAQKGFAQKAYDITGAGYSEAHADAARQIVNSLAARGMLNSGDRGWLLSKENRRYGRQTALAKNSLAQYLSGLMFQLQNAQTAGAGQLAGYRQQAANYVQQAYPATVTHPNSWLQ